MGFSPKYVTRPVSDVTVYVQRKQFVKFVPKIGHSGVGDVNGYELGIIEGIFK